MYNLNTKAFQKIITGQQYDESVLRAAVQITMRCQQESIVALLKQLIRSHSISHSELMVLQDWVVWYDSNGEVMSEALFRTIAGTDECNPPALRRIHQGLGCWLVETLKDECCTIFRGDFVTAYHVYRTGLVI